MIHNVKTLLNAESALPGVTVKGWVRTRRDARDFSFFEVNDGSCLANIQVIAEAALPGYQELKHINTGAAIAVQGNLVESPGKGQRWELRASTIELIGGAG